MGGQVGYRRGQVATQYFRISDESTACFHVLRIEDFGYLKLSCYVVNCEHSVGVLNPAYLQLHRPYVPRKAAVHEDNEYGDRKHKRKIANQQL